MNLHRINVPLALLVAFIVSISAANFYRSVGFEYVDYDGFQYLAFSKSVLSNSNFYENTIRSPILALIIPPAITLARIEMIMFHVMIVILIYMITNELTKNKNASLFSSLLYGTNWWMVVFLSSTLSDLPAMMFFFLSLFFWLHDNRKHIIYSGIFAGIALITRFDIIVLLLPVALFTLSKRFRREFFVPVFIISVPFEIFTSWLVFGRLVYPPLEFWNENFVYGTAYALNKAFDAGVLFVMNKMVEFAPLLFALFLISFLAKKDRNYNQTFFLTAFVFLVLSLLPMPDNRVFMVKLVPLMSIMAGYAYLALREKFKKAAGYVIGTIAIVYAVYNLVFLFSVQYPVWKLSETPCFDGVVCTNAPSILNYYCEKNAVDIHRIGSRHINTDPKLDKNSTVFYNLGMCDYLVYYNVSFGYDAEIDKLIRYRYETEQEAGFASIYRLK